jgi:hypothetical protein
MRVGSRAILHSTEGAASLLTGGWIARDVAIPHPLGRLPRCVARSFRNRAGRHSLAHIAPVLIPQALIRIGYAAAMLRIMRPCTSPMRVANISGVEIVLVNKRIIHNDSVIAPSGMPAPTAPSVPAASEEETDVDAGAEAEV